MKLKYNFIDVSKGLGILLVVLGHTYGIPHFLYNLIYSFHMPLFFIISGWVYNEEKYNKYSFKEVFIKKAQSYLVPYYLFSFVNLILKFVFNLLIYKKSMTIENIIKDILGIVYCYADMEHMPNCSPIWFFMCLFLATLMFWTVIKYGKKYVAVIAILMMTISYLLCLLVNIRLPLNMATSFMAVFFMCIGNFAKNNVEKLKKLMLLLPLGIIAGLMNGGRVGMNENNYGNLLLFLISSIIISISIILITKKGKYANNNIFIWLGNNTMLFVGFNYFMRDFTTELYYLIPGIRSIKLHWSISFLLTTVGLSILVWIWSKSELKVVKYIKNNIYRSIKY